MCVGAGDRVHAVEAHAKAGGEQRPDRIEVEQRPHQRGPVLDRIDDRDHGAADMGFADDVEIDVRRVLRLVGRDGLGVREDRVGDLLRRRAAVADVVFDAEVALGSAGIMARRQDEAAKGADSPDQRGDRRRRQQAALADEDTAEAVGGGDPDHLLDRLAIVIASVAAQNQSLAGETLDRVECRLDEILDVVRLLEFRHLLAKARRARLLVGIGLGFDGADHPRRSP